jgi:cation transport regulator ChaC
MSSASIPIEWDHELGVWIGEKAPGIDPKDFPNPFYVFGYGSLIWKMGPLEKFPHFSGQAVGFKRLFAQRSYDHRGNKYFPGLVLNLVSNDILSKNGLSIIRNHREVYRGEWDDRLITSSETSTSFSKSMSNSPSDDDCDGLVWLVPQEEILPLIEYLDYREKGGYFQTFIDVRLHEDSEHHRKGDIIKALVYIGHDHNPNFFLPSSPTHSSSSYLSFHDFQSRSTVSDIISTAVGPSGSNIEYLFNLYADLLSRGIHDQYLHNLVVSVRQRIGVWRRKHFYRKIFAKHQLKTYSEITVEEDYSIPVRLGGFGSNEFHQLTGKHPKVETQDSEIYHDECYFRPVDITLSLPEVTPSVSNLSPSLSTSVSTHVGWSDLEHYHVLAGSNSSAFVNDFQHSIRIWGKLGETILNKHFSSSVSNVEGENIMNPEGEPFSIIIKGVTGAAIGYDHILLRLEANPFLVCLGNNELFGCEGPSSVLIPSGEIKLIQCSSVSGSSSSHIYKIEHPSSYDSSFPKYNVLKMVSSIHHSAVITECGGLITWGKKKFGQVLDEEIWYPPVDQHTGNSTKLIDVACGVRHTVVLDDHGWIHSMGDNTYNSLGRQTLPHTDPVSHPLVDNTMKLVQVPTDVKFQRVRLAVFLFNFFHAAPFC